jgi:hypothetical protein
MQNMYIFEVKKLWESIHISKQKKKLHFIWKEEKDWQRLSIVVALLNTRRVQGLAKNGLSKKEENWKVSKRISELGNHWNDCLIWLWLLQTNILY